MKKKDYKDLTTNELARITESMCVRLPLFNGDFPTFMPQSVKAIMEHPNLTRTDYDKLNTFSRMFELDWRGDRSFENKTGYLGTNPIYLNLNDKDSTCSYDEFGNFEVSALLRQACVPYVSELTKKMMSKTADVKNKNYK